MPASRIAWSAKHAPDPEHPGYVKVVGSYAHDFLKWAKGFGRPAWSPRGDACVLSLSSFPLQGLYWPLSVLEPVFEANLKSRVVAGIVVNGEQKFYLR